MGQLLLRRIWLLVALAAVAGITVFLTTRGADVVYERTTVFVLRPSALIEDAQIPDAIRGIAQQDSQLIHTISRVIETESFLREAFVGVRTDGERVEGIDPRFEIQSAISPGSDVIEVAVRGPDEAALDLLAENFATRASGWVSEVYRAYSLDLLEISEPPGPVSTDPTQLILLAILLGLLIGVGVVAAEHKTYQRAGDLRLRSELPELHEPVVPKHVRTQRRTEQATSVSRAAPSTNPASKRRSAT